MSSPHLARGVAGKGSALEARLVRRIGAGDSRALLVLYRRYSGMLRALTRRVLDDSSDAEEVLQEVFLQVWNRIVTQFPLGSS
jgi:RNA polymerase sigma-70 factor (ECF subfamily)